MWFRGQVGTHTHRNDRQSTSLIRGTSRSPVGGCARRVYWTRSAGASDHWHPCGTDSHLGGGLGGAGTWQWTGPLATGETRWVTVRRMINEDDGLGWRNDRAASDTLAAVASPG